MGNKCLVNGSEMTSNGLNATVKADGANNGVMAHGPL